VFRGESALSMDAKGRLAIPTRYREHLADTCNGRLVVTISLHERCLVVYPLPDWERIEGELQQLPALDRKGQSIVRLLTGQATDCELDGHGRMLIPPTLREFAGLDRRVRLIGQMRRFELWDEASWNSRRDALLGQIDDLLEGPSEALAALRL